MTLVAPTMERLCGDIDDFVSQYWEQRPLVRHGEAFDDLFSVDVADQLLGAGALQVPTYIRLSRIEPTVSDWEKHCRWIETELGQLVPIIDVASALREFEAGRTIILHALRERVPALDRFAHRIEDEIGHHVSADAFITPPHSQCWEPHYDFVDLFVVQIHGSKEWQLWEPTVAQPIASHCPDQEVVRGEPHNVTLHPGDVLYLPRGTSHAATTADEASMHVTVSINVTTWRDAIRKMLGPLHLQSELRESLPIGYNNDASLLVDGTVETLDLVASMLSEREPAAAAALLADRPAPQRDTKVGQLSQAIRDAEASAVSS